MNLVTNGNFENGSLDGWDIHFGTISTRTNFFGKVRRKIDWDYTNAYQPQPKIVEASDLLPQQGQPIPIFEGFKMLRINDLTGDNHVTCLHQTIELPEDFHAECSYLKLKWAALLQGSGHEEILRPKFSVSINRKKKITLSSNEDKVWRKVSSVSLIAPEGNLDNWIDVRKQGETEAIWFKNGELSLNLGIFKGGDKLRIRLVAEDCSEGGHGGAAFIDDIKIIDACLENSNFYGNSNIPNPTLHNVFTPNGDGINDIWGISDVQNVCKIDTEIYNRWGEIVFASLTYPINGQTPIFVNIWDGYITTKRNKKGNKKKKKQHRMVLPNDGVMFYIIKLSNCLETKEYTGNITIF